MDRLEARQTHSHRPLQNASKLTKYSLYASTQYQDRTFSRIERFGWLNSEA